MHKTARQKYVLEIITEQGQASITELAEKLQVSADTIRRDLTDLEKQGLAQKNHGGAIAPNLSTMNELAGIPYCLKSSSGWVNRLRSAYLRARRFFWTPEAHFWPLPLSCRDR